MKYCHSLKIILTIPLTVIFRCQVNFAVTKNMFMVVFKKPLENYAFRVTPSKQC